MTNQSALGSHKIMAFVATRDSERAKTFYGDTLGLRLISDDPFAVVFDANGTMLRVTKVREFTPFNFTVLGWEVPDIAAAVRRLGEAGVQFERYGSFMKQDELGIWDAPGGGRIAWFKDPDGNTLSLAQM
ncbi:MAG: VOC family protein [Bryobacterales bacterium]|nr:VOC family protein [Bryobacterales bacterium]